MERRDASNIIDAAIRFREHSSESLETFYQPPHDNGDGGGGMDGRVAALEKRVGRVEDKLDRISETVARIDAKLDSKIDYKWLTVYVLGIIAVIMRSEIASWVSSVSAP